jgi:hypothetical protein
MKRIPLPWTDVHAFTQVGAKKFLPATPWMPAEMAKRARGTFELIASQPNLSVTFAYQTAQVENSPDVAQDAGAAQQSDGMAYGAMTDISAATNGKQLVRFGFHCYNTNAAVLVTGRAGGFVDISADS